MSLIIMSNTYRIQRFPKLYKQVVDEPRQSKRFGLASATRIVDAAGFILYRRGQSIDRWVRAILRFRYGGIQTACFTKGLTSKRRMLRCDRGDPIGYEASHVSLKLYPPATKLSQTEQSPTRWVTPWTLVGIYHGMHGTIETSSGASTIRGSSSVAMVEQPAPCQQLLLLLSCNTRLRLVTTACSTNRSAGPTATTASSACPAVGITADITVLDSCEAVAALLPFSTAGGRIAASIAAVNNVNGTKRTSRLPWCTSLTPWRPRVAAR